MADLGSEIFELYSRKNPNDIFRMGDPAFAGKTFVPSDSEVRAIRSKAGELRSRTDDPVEKGVLDNMTVSLDFNEPYAPLNEILWGVFSHLVVEGVVPANLEKYFESSLATLAESGDVLGGDWSPIVRIRTYQNAVGVIGILGSVRESLAEKEGSDKALELLDVLLGKLEPVKERFQSPGIEEGDFTQVFPYLQEHRDHVGRDHIYPDILSKLYGFYETTGEIDTMASKWLEEELPLFFESRSELAKLYSIDDEQAAVTEALKASTTLDKSGIVEFLGGFRSVLQPLFEKNVVGIAPGYRTEIIETPPYLINFIPTAAMSPFNALEGDPYNYFFVTTDAKRSPPVGLADMFQLIIHEEYGHCVNFSNSASDFGPQADRLELLPTQMSLPISDGISFFRELESLRLVQDIADRASSGSGLDALELALVDHVELMAPFERFLAEVRFIVYQWRIVRFLRAIGDIRINMHQMDYASFVEWAAERTQLDRKLIHDQLFLFQSWVGYAPSYSVGGQSLRSMQDELKGRGVEPRDFNTIACSMGFSPRAHYERVLKELCLKQARN